MKIGRIDRRAAEAEAERQKRQAEIESLLDAIERETRRLGRDAECSGFSENCPV